MPDESVSSRLSRLLKPRLPFGRGPAPFPPDFLFGVGTSDHQCEAYEPRWEDVRDRWERERGKTPRGRAADFWTRHGEDIELARVLGCRAFRFSVAWARVEPEPGRFDPDVLRHYRGIVRRIGAAGMVPVVTLHHFTWPLHVEARGGMISAGFPAWFAEYADRVAEALGPEVGYWITFNEPTFLPLGYFKPWGMRDYLLPPGVEGASSGEQVRGAEALMRNLFLAHREARLRIRARHRGARVGANPFVLGLPAGLQRWLDLRVRAVRSPEAWRKLERSTLEGYPDLLTGVVDVMFGAFTRTPEREKQVLFSIGYASCRPAVIVALDDPARDLADLAGARIAAVRASSAPAALARCGGHLELRWTRSLDVALRDLERGRVRGVLSDDRLLEPFLDRAPGRWRLVPLDVPPQEYGAAVALNREALRRETDAAIREVRGEPAPGAPGRGRRRDAWLSADALAAVRRRGVLVVGLRRGDSPFARRDPETGAWSGLEVDIARALARRLLGDASRVRFLAFDPMWRMSVLRSLWLRPLEFLQRLLTLFSTVANTDWWYLGMAGQLPAFLCPPECVGEMDFVGVDYYWGIPELRWDRMRALYDSVRADYERAPVHPRGLRRLLSRYARMFPGVEILVVENGCIEKADGVDRTRYLRAHAGEVQRAVAAGIPVRGYLYWSLTSNREWGRPFGPDSDFGLFHVDLDRDPELRRVPTPAAEAYREILRTRTAFPAPGGGVRDWMRRMGR